MRKNAADRGFVNGRDPQLVGGIQFSDVIPAILYNKKRERP